MAAKIGRTIAFTWNGSAIGGVREKSVAFNGEAIDITSDEDGGWRKVIEPAAVGDTGENSIDLTLSGVTKANTLRDAWMSFARTGTAAFAYADGALLTGTFVIASFSETAPYKDAVTFEVTLQSSGAVIYTAAP